MKTIEFTEDGDFVFKKVDLKTPYLLSTIFNIESNVDEAEVTVGYENEDGDFASFGVVTTGKRIAHDGKTTLMVRFDGIGSNPVKIGYSE